jgi:hypothetical protein
MTVVVTRAELLTIGDIALIPLPRGSVSMIDSEDARLVLQYRWSSNGKRVARAVKKNEEWFTLWLHRVLLDAPDGVLVDHKNGNGLDNRRSNLRLASHAQNQFNAKKSTGFSSSYKGVNWLHKLGKWGAKITVNYRQIHLGCFTSEIEAGRAYDDAARRYFGQYACLNFPESDEQGISVERDGF